MDWHEARQETLDKWQRIRKGIGNRDVLALITELNEACAVCELARSEATEPAERCSHCIVFGDAERCSEARWRICEALLDDELDEARAAVTGVLACIVAARPPENG